MGGAICVKQIESYRVETGMGGAICVAARVPSCRGWASRDRCPVCNPPINHTDDMLHELPSKKTFYKFTFKSCSHVTQPVLCLHVCHNRHNVELKQRWCWHNVWTNLRLKQTVPKISPAHSAFITAWEQDRVRDRTQWESVLSSVSVGRRNVPPCSLPRGRQVSHQTNVRNPQQVQNRVPVTPGR